MVYNLKEYKRMIIDHYSKNWGTDFKEKNWTKGLIELVVPNFSILEYCPNSYRSMWTYATCGMSNPNHSFPIELHIFSSIKDDTILELLSAICYYHNVDKNLNLGNTVNFGRPWQDSSESSFGLISLPYLDGPSLEIMDYPSNRNTCFYWLIPITKEEMELKKEFGLDALEERFDETEFNYLDPKRKSVV